MTARFWGVTRAQNDLGTSCTGRRWESVSVRWSGATLRGRGSALIRCAPRLQWTVSPGSAKRLMAADDVHSLSWACPQGLARTLSLTEQVPRSLHLRTWRAHLGCTLTQAAGPGRASSAVLPASRQVLGTARGWRVEREFAPCKQPPTDSVKDAQCPFAAAVHC